MLVRHDAALAYVEVLIQYLDDAAVGGKIDRNNFNSKQKTSISIQKEEIIKRKKKEIEKKVDSFLKEANVQICNKRLILLFF